MSKFDKSVPTADEISSLRQVATGVLPADVAIRGGHIVRVHTAEIITGDVIIKGRHIAAITPPGRLQAESEVDADGAFVAPTFIDAHTHLEGARLTVGQHARLSVPRGTTTFFNHANSLSDVLGPRGVDWLHETDAPLRIFEQTVPFITGRGVNELGGLEIGLDENLDRLQQRNTVSLGESNPYVLEPERARELSRALESGKRITGHTARMADEALWGYLAGGVGDDHNAATLPEVLDRLRLGAIVTLQSGSLTNYIKDILANPEALGLVGSHICFCADGKYVADIHAEGHIDHHARSAVALGVSPALAIRMGSLNAALHYRVDHLIGSLTPTRLADVQILPDLEDFRPTSVWVGGVEVAREGKPLFEDASPPPEWTRNTVNLGASFGVSNLAVPAPPGATTATVRAMELYDGYYKRALTVELPVENGNVLIDPATGFAKLVVIDRHHGSGKAGVSFLRGFGLTKGALGISTNTGNNNLVIVGASDEDIVAAAKVLEDLGGGWVVVADGKMLGQLPFRVAGVVSDEPWERVIEQSVEVDRAAAELGCDVRLPFQILGYVPLNGVPDYGLTELGLIDVATNRLIDVLVTTA
jgi:adenine deaminase